MATPAVPPAALKALQDSGVAQTDGHSASGLCTVPLSALVKLLTAATGAKAGNLDDAPAFLVLRAAIDGTTLDDCVLFKFVFEISVLANAWTQVKLLPESIAIVASTISSAARGDESEADGPVSSEAVITTAQGQHCFLAHKAGVYTVAVEGLSAYANKAKTQVDLQRLPPCSRCVHADLHHYHRLTDCCLPLLRLARASR